MPAKAIVFGIALVMTVGLVTSLVELIVPITAKINLNACCRNALLRMEAEGGLTQENREDLIDSLRENGFANIIVTGTIRASKGEKVFLSVRADYEYSRMTGFFYREKTVQPMSYERISVARKVVN